MNDSGLIQAVRNFIAKEVAVLLRNTAQEDGGVDSPTELQLSLPEEILSQMAEGVSQAEEKGLPVPDLVQEVVDSGKADSSHILAAKEFFYKNPYGPEQEEESQIKFLMFGEAGTGAGRDWWRKALRTLEHSVSKEVMPSGFFVQKDLSGNWRWFGWVTNNFIDREEEILVDSAHKEFSAFLDENPDEAPELWSWHTPGTARKFRADWWDYADGFFVYSGPLTEEEAKQYQALEGKDIGMSHGFYVLKRIGKYILKYRTFEVSDLPREVAANPYTQFNVERIEEEKMFTERKRAYLVEQFGEEKVAQLEAETEDRAKVLQDMGVTQKEIDAQYEEHLEQELAERIATEASEQAKDIVTQVVDRVKEGLNVEQLREVLKGLREDIQAVKESAPAMDERIAALEESVQHLLETEDKKIADAFSQDEPIDWGLAASHSKETEVEEEDLSEEEKDELEDKSNGQFSWVQDVAGQ